jgi:hypothetical protein
MNTRSLLPCFSLIVVVAAAAPAGAATITYDLTGNPADLQPNPPPANTGPVEQHFPLVDADNGATVLPAGVLSVGDTINFNVTFSSPLTVPAAGPGFAQVQLNINTNAMFGVSSVVAESYAYYYENGFVVTPPAELVTAGANADDTGLLSLGVTSSFSFDRLMVSDTVESLTVNGESVSQVPLFAASPEVSLEYYPTPVPLPGALWLLLSGLGALGASRKALGRP